MFSLLKYTWVPVLLGCSIALSMVCDKPWNSAHAVPCVILSITAFFHFLVTQLLVVTIHKWERYDKKRFFKIVSLSYLPFITAEFINALVCTGDQFSYYLFGITGTVFSFLLFLLLMTRSAIATFEKLIGIIAFEIIVGCASFYAVYIIILMIIWPK